MLVVHLIESEIILALYEAEKIEQLKMLLLTVETSRLRDRYKVSEAVEPVDYSR